jgi:hypothetical protein
MKKLLAICVLAILTVNAMAQKTGKFGEHNYPTYATELIKETKAGDLKEGEYKRTYINLVGDSLHVTTEKYDGNNKVIGIDVRHFDFKKCKITGPSQTAYGNLYGVTVTNNGERGLASGYAILNTGYKYSYDKYITAYLMFKDEAAAKAFIQKLK